MARHWLGISVVFFWVVWLSIGTAVFYPAVHHARPDPQSVFIVGMIGWVAICLSGLWVFRAMIRAMGRWFRGVS